MFADVLMIVGCLFRLFVGRKDCFIRVSFDDCFV